MVSNEDDRFSIIQQCKMLRIHRSGVYYKPAEASQRDLEIMRAMDALYLEDPTRGTRRYRDDLRQLGHIVGRDKMRSLMRVMGIEAIYCRPRTTVLDPTKYKYPYLLGGIDIVRPNQAWGHRYQLHTHAQRLYVSVCYYRYLQPLHCGLEHLQYHGG